MSTQFQEREHPKSSMKEGSCERILETLKEQGVAFSLESGGQRRSPDVSGGPRELILLVNRDNTQRTEAVLSSLGFKRALSTTTGSWPLDCHFVGWDSGRDDFLRLHVHYRPATRENSSSDGGCPLAKSWSRPRGRQERMRLTSGGALIAVVGSDGAGKSTVLSQCERWLSGVFHVRKVHAGKPPTTWLTFPCSLALALFRGVRRWRSSRAQPAADSTVHFASESGEASLAYALRAVILAWERRQLLVRCGRLAAKGRLVLCDRYPSDTSGAMDSPRLCVSLDRRGGFAAIRNGLARIEARLYRQIPPPDVVLRLSVSLDTAKQRNRDRPQSERDDEGFIEFRHRHNVPWQKSGTQYVHDILADGSLADTVRAAKEAIWRSV